jgi:hypothetical protein
MLGNRRIFQGFAAVLALAIAAAATPADAQQRYRAGGGGGFFQNLFGGGNSYQPGGGGYYQQRPPETEAPQVDNSRAPAPRKPDPTAVPTTSIVVMGDAMADWLAYGLEDAFADSPEVAIVRKNKRNSGLLRYEYKSDLDWWHAAHDILAQEKADYVVMMLGLSDRQSIREKDAAKEPDTGDVDKKTADDKTADPATQNQDQDDPDNSIVAPEPKGKKANGSIEFRTDKWAEIYSRRIDATVAALKSKGVPVFWVGLPSIRGPKATADAVYLNDLYRARAERAGAVYIDVWDGFVDEGGKFTTQGPDFEGQLRKLRTADGVYFTKSGARKLAHYVEREIRRYMNNRAVTVSLPTGPITPAPDAKSAVRPLAGPVLPLTVSTSTTDELAGGNDTRPVHGDSIASSVLLKGEPISAPAGRADDFAWPRTNAAPVTAVSAAASAPAELDLKPAVKGQIKTEAKPEPKGKAKTETKPVTRTAQDSEARSLEKPKPKPAQAPPPRPPRPVGQSNPFSGLFGR